MSDKPDYNTGRAPDGRWTKDFKGGPGRGNGPKRKPNTNILFNFRQAAREATSVEEFQKVFRVVVDAALDPKLDMTQRLQAAQIYMDRTIGRPAPQDLQEEIEFLETQLLEMRRSRQEQNERREAQN